MHRHQTELETDTTDKKLNITYILLNQQKSIPAEGANITFFFPTVNEVISSGVSQLGEMVAEAHMTKQNLLLYQWKQYS